MVIAILTQGLTDGYCDPCKLAYTDELYVANEIGKYHLG
jgi:hypothetical protein